MKMISSLENLSKPFWVAAGFALMGIVGVIDFMLGYEIAFSLFYLIPISLVTWFAGKWVGIAISAASALAWYIADTASGQSHSHPAFIIGTPA